MSGSDRASTTLVETLFALPWDIFKSGEIFWNEFKKQGTADKQIHFCEIC